MIGRAHVDFLEGPVVSPAGADSDAARPVAEIRAFDIGLNPYVSWTHLQTAARGQDRLVLFAKRCALLWGSAATHQEIVGRGFQHKRLSLRAEAAKALGFERVGVHDETVQPYTFLLLHRFPLAPDQGAPGRARDDFRHQS